MNAALEYLAGQRERLGLDRLGLGETPPCVFITPRFRESRHVVILLLSPESGRPVLVAKLPRLTACDRALAREAYNLRALENVQSELDEGSVPALVAFEEDGQYPLLLETALCGEPISPVAIRRNRSGTVTAASRWLEQLGAATRSQADGTWYERLVTAPLHALLARAADGQVRELVGETLAGIRYVNLDYLGEQFRGEARGPRLIESAEEWAEPTWRHPACDTVDWAVELHAKSSRTFTVSWSGRPSPRMNSTVAVSNRTVIHGHQRAAPSPHSR